MAGEFDIVAWWGAVVATIVAMTQLYDRLLHKPIPTTTFLMSGSEGVGNHVIAINASTRPVLVTGWELYWAKPERLGFGMTRRPAIAESDFDDLSVLTLAPHGHKKWSFTEQNHFTWGWEMAAKGQLYLELNIVGRKRPVVLFVFNPHPDSYEEPRSLRRLLPHGLRPRPRFA